MEKVYTELLLAFLDLGKPEITVHILIRTMFGF